VRAATQPRGRRRAVAPDVRGRRGPEGSAISHAGMPAAAAWPPPAV